MSRFRLALSWQATQEEQRLITDRLPQDVDVRAPASSRSYDRHVCDPAELMRIARDADAIMGWIVPDAVIREGRELVLVQALHAGVDHVDFELLRSRSIRLGNVAGANGTAVAEHAMALVLGLAKRLLQNHAAARESRYLPLWSGRDESVQLAGKAMAVIGLGNIGRRVVGHAAAFGMSVVGVVRPGAPARDAGTESVRPLTEIDDVLRAVDVVVVCAPLTPETRHLIGAPQLAAMKQTALLVNVSRAELIDEAALAEALRAEAIGGYAGDVWWFYERGTVGAYYGFPSMLGVHLLPNVLVSADRASNTPEVRRAMIVMGAENVASFIGDGTLRGEVDTERGY